MRIIQARNVHQALATGLAELFANGIQRDSRNGPVLQSPVPVTTVYERPWERVVFWTQRDANPFFHFYEAMWMLAGRNDLAGPMRYAKRMADYSDDGKTMNGSAYGYRWRVAHDPLDQITEVVRMLRANTNDRRAMLQMWDAGCDLGSSSKDVPCNTMAAVQVNTSGKLDLTVFCRSNDIVWGAYGANAVHFSMLLEYLAGCIGVPVGRYYQVSINWHGYLSTIEPLRSLTTWEGQNVAPDPYVQRLCAPVPMFPKPWMNGAMLAFDTNLNTILNLVDEEVLTFGGAEEWRGYPFFHTFYVMMLAHQQWRQLKGSPAERYVMSMSALGQADVSIDWIRAGKEWMQRRALKESAREPSTR